MDASSDADQGMLDMFNRRKNDAEGAKNEVESRIRAGPGT